MKSEKNIQYRYADIITLGFSINEPNVQDMEAFKQSLETNISTDVLFHEDLNQLMVDIHIHAAPEDDELEVFSLHVRHLFALKDIESLISSKAQEKALELSKENILMFTSVAYSTTRGMLKTKLAGSRFSEYILPIIDPHKLAPEGSVPVIAGSV